MRGRLRNSALDFPVALLSAVLLHLLCPGPAPAAAAKLFVEPGVPVAGDRWLLPLQLVDESGAGVALAAADLSLTLADGRPLTFVLEPFAPGAGGRPAAVSVVLGRDGLTPGAAAVTAGFLAAADAATPRGLWLTGPEPQRRQALGATPLTAEAAQQTLAREGTGRLWDTVLAALIDLAGREGPQRRSLVVIADGGEDQPSEHPQATCAEAAERARIAVHVLILPGDEAGAVRLRDLAARSGGLAVTGGGRETLRRFLATIEGFAGAWIEAPGDAALPAEVRLEVVQGRAAVAAGGRIAARAALEGPGPMLLVVLLMTLLAAAGGGFGLFWLHRRTAGVLVWDAGQGPQALPVRRAGVTIGTRPDNSLVLSDQRVSRHHAVVRARGTQVILTDLRSTNGTEVGGRPVRTAVLRDGDRIRLGGGIELVFHKEAPRGGR